MRAWSADARLRPVAAAVFALSWLGPVRASASSDDAASTHQIRLEASTLALGSTSVWGDDDHYGGNTVWAIPGIGADYRFSLSRHLGLGVVVEHQRQIGRDDYYAWRDAETRTMAVTRGELLFAARIFLPAPWQLHFTAGLGPDYIRFRYAGELFAGSGLHLAQRSGVTYGLSESYGLTVSTVTALGAATNDAGGDDYLADSDAMYLILGLHLGVVWWPG